MLRAVSPSENPIAGHGQEAEVFVQLVDALTEVIVHQAITTERKRPDDQRSAP